MDGKKTEPNALVINAYYILLLHVMTFKKLLLNVYSPPDIIYRHGTGKEAEFLKAAYCLHLCMNDAVFCFLDHIVPLTLVHSVQKIVSGISYPYKNKRHMYIYTHTHFFFLESP